MVFKRLLSSVEGGEMLDLGCGSGQFTDVLVKSLGSFRSVTGVDVDEDALEEARINHRDPAFRFLRISEGPLPFDPDSFDLVAISKTLHHLADPEMTLDEMKRVLRKGGYFLINEMHRDCLSEAQESHMLYHHLRSDVDTLLGLCHHHTFHRNELIKLAEGLELEDRVIVEFSPESNGTKDPAVLEEYGQKMDGWLEKLEGRPEREEISGRVKSLKERFRKAGIARPPQMVILGRKFVT